MSSAFVEEVTAEVGDSLRVVATHEEREYDFQYLRDDLQAGYTTEEFDRIFDELVIEGMQKDYFEGLFHVGPLDCVVFGFDRAIIFYFPREGFSGLVVSIDRDARLRFGPLMEGCKDGLLAGS